MLVVILVIKAAHNKLDQDSAMPISNVSISTLWRSLYTEV